MAGWAASPALESVDGAGVFTTYGAHKHAVVISDGAPTPALGSEFDRVSLSVLVDLVAVRPDARTNAIGVF
eukprot:scaffold421177_cov49-Attheya_sp.AAC.1